MSESKVNVSPAGIPKDNVKERNFTLDEVRAVNNILGIGNKDLAKVEDFPQAIDVKKWWKITEPILFAHPRDRELFIGWDLTGDTLKPVEINEGIPFKEIKQDYAATQIGKITAGRVISSAHVLCFHSHPELPKDIEELRAKSRKGKSPTAIERLLEIVPQSEFGDTLNLLAGPNEYASVVIDVSSVNKGLIPILVMVRSKESPVITKDNYYIYDKKLKELHLAQILGFDIDLTFWESLGKKRKPKYKDVLTKDRPWHEEFGLVFYRGFLSRNLEEHQAIRKSVIKSRESGKKE